MLLIHITLQHKHDSTVVDLNNLRNKLSKSLKGNGVVTTLILLHLDRHKHLEGYAFVCLFVYLLFLFISVYPLCSI